MKSRHSSLMIVLGVIMVLGCSLVRADVALDFDRLFGHSFGVFDSRINSWGGEVINEEKQYLVKLEMPGIDPKDIEVSYDRHVLVVKGEQKCERCKKTKPQSQDYRSQRAFYRSITLPENIDGDKVSAKAKNGVLTVILPKAKSEAAKKIEVQS
jgi:Molecular chaperone (small heat shock protein)